MPSSRKFPVERPERLALEHRDYELLLKLETAIYRHAGGVDKFASDIPTLLRQAIDEVIDAARSGRFLLKDLQNTEKTYLGTKVEILLRNHLKLNPSTLLDVVIDGVDVDIKNTVGTSWMIPKEAIGHPCILIRVDEERARCWFGLVVAHADVLNQGANRDVKVTISAQHFVNILWMLYGHPYPLNFWEDVEPAFRNKLMALDSGNKRVTAFFKHYTRVPISRKVITAFVPQKDPLKRLRKNGGAADQLEREGIALLSGAFESELIKSLNLPHCRSDEWISILPNGETELSILRQKGYCLADTPQRSAGL
jgi:hypothetical protein